jgi:PAS domain S-box-containing protein
MATQPKSPVAATKPVDLEGNVDALALNAASDPSRSALDALAETSALEMLARVPIPVLAVGHAGVILFANTAFAEMVGRRADVVLAMRFGEIFYTSPTDDSAVSFMREFAGLVVQLAHADGSVVMARMSKSALMRTGDQLALTAFQDITEQMWATS